MGLLSLVNPDGELDLRLFVLPGKPARGTTPRPLHDRFWDAVDVDGTGCWLWTGGTRGEYGLFCIDRHLTIVAHRAAWFFANGPFLAALKVLHDCDVPLCVKPMHLFLGTQADNMRDMKEKGRSLRSRPSGRGRLTPEQVFEIRSSDLSQAQLAVRFGISQPAIWYVQQRLSYAYL